MGTWGTGPFDNDAAADWCGSLDDADPDERVGMIRTALAAAAGEDGYLDMDAAVEAVAAAAIVASQRPTGTPIGSPYAPDFLTGAQPPVLPAELDALALRALDRISAEESEWRDLWAESDRFDDAVAELDAIRTVLAP